MFLISTKAKKRCIIYVDTDLCVIAINRLCVFDKKTQALVYLDCNFQSLFGKKLATLNIGQFNGFIWHSN